MTNRYRLYLLAAIYIAPHLESGIALIMSALMIIGAMFFIESDK